MEKAEDACRALSDLCKLDPADHVQVRASLCVLPSGFLTLSVQARPDLLRTLLDMGLVENVKDILDEYTVPEGSPHAVLFAWSKAVVEYALWAVLEDGEGSEESAKKALRHPHPRDAAHQRCVGGMERCLPREPARRGGAGLAGDLRGGDPGVACHDGETAKRSQFTVAAKKL